MSNRHKLAILPMWVIDQIKERMTLGPAAWQSITDAVEQAEVPQVLPCEVKLPPGTVIGKGVPVSTLMLAIAQRQGRPAHARAFAEQRQSEPVALPSCNAKLSDYHDWDQGYRGGWRACLDEIAKLGPLYTHADPSDIRVTKQALESLKGEASDLRAELATWKRRAIEAESKLRTYDPKVVELGEQAMQALLAEPRPNELVLTKCRLCDQLQADLTARDERIDTLVDDLDQAQYDKDAWKNEEESLWVQVFHGEGDDPFINAVSGAICIEQLTLIQEQIVIGAEDLFESGPGFYVLECRHCKAHYDNVGMTEPAHWEIDFESYSRFPWADEAEAMVKEAQAEYPDCPTHAPDKPCPGCGTPGYTAACDKCIPY